MTPDRLAQIVTEIRQYEWMREEFDFAILNELIEAVKESQDVRERCAQLVEAELIRWDKENEGAASDDLTQPDLEGLADAIRGLK